MRPAWEGEKGVFFCTTLYQAVPQIRHLPFLLRRHRAHKQTKQTGKQTEAGEQSEKANSSAAFDSHMCSDMYSNIHTYSILVGGEICSIFWYVLFVGWRVGLPPQSDMPPQPQKGKSELGLLLTLLGFLHSETATQTKEVSRPAGFGFPHLSEKYEASVNYNKNIFIPIMEKIKTKEFVGEFRTFHGRVIFRGLFLLETYVYEGRENINCAPPSVLRLGRRWLANLGLLARSRG